MKKHLRQSLFLNKVAGWGLHFIKKETLAQVLSWEFCEMFKNTFFLEHLRTSSSVPCNVSKDIMKVSSIAHYLNVWNVLLVWNYY